MESETTDAFNPATDAVSDESGLNPLTNLDGLLKQRADSLDGYLVTVGEQIALPELRTTLRTHLIPVDANGILQTGKLSELLANLVTDYCLPRDRRTQALVESQRIGSLEPINALRQEAIELFVDSDTSGEAGELLLYLLTERVLGAPQILSKMTLKTSSKMHFHGADGVHAKKTNDGLALYWGESKMHENRSDAVRDCLKSITPFLTDIDRKTATRDLGLVRDNLDVEAKGLKDEMVRFFIKRNPEWNRLELRASCLIGFNVDDYPKHQKAIDIGVDAQINKEIEAWVKHLDKHIRKKQLNTFEIDFFMIPFSSVADFRELMLDALGVKK